MAGRKPIHFTPRDRSVTFSPKPRAPSRPRRGQVIQFETAGVPDAARGEEQRDARGTEDGDGPVPAPAQAGGPPRLIDADGGPPQHGAAATQGVWERAHDPDEGVKLLIMHAVSGWVAVVMERAVYSIQIAPVGSGKFQVETALLGADGVVARQPEVLYLRVSCALQQPAERCDRQPVSKLGLAPQPPQLVCSIFRRFALILQRHLIASRLPRAMKGSGTVSPEQRHCSTGSSPEFMRLDSLSVAAVLREVWKAPSGRSVGK